MPRDRATQGLASGLTRVSITDVFHVRSGVWVGVGLIDDVTVKSDRWVKGMPCWQRCIQALFSISYLSADRGEEGRCPSLTARGEVFVPVSLERVEGASRVGETAYRPVGILTCFGGVDGFWESVVMIIPIVNLQDLNMSCFVCVVSLEQC